MKLVHVLPSQTDSGAGLTEAARSLCTRLAKDASLQVSCVSLNHQPGTALDWGSVQTFGLPSRFGGFVQGLNQLLDAENPDVVHIHGHWVGLSSQAAAWARNAKKPYVFSPHGMLDVWALRNSRWKKQLYWHLVEKRLARGAAGFHVLTAHERGMVARLLPSIEMQVIPNGVQIPPEAQLQQIGKHEGSRRRLLFLSRLHPKKGVLELIQAWARLVHESGANWPWELEIAGAGDPGYVAALKKEAGGLLEERIFFSGHVSGDRKASCFQNADAFVLPSKSEGLPVAVLEAWSYALPVAMTDGCYLPEAFEAKVAHRIELGALLVETLREFCSSPSELLVGMGRKARVYVADRYSWDRVATEFERWYEELIQQNKENNHVLSK